MKMFRLKDLFEPGGKPFRDGMTVIDLLFLGGGFENTERLNENLYGKSRLYKKKRRLRNLSLYLSIDSVVRNGIAYKI